MRILHVSERVSPIGGCERMLRDTCRMLAAAGHEVSVLVAEDTPAGSFALPLERLPRSRGPRVALRMRPQLDAILDRQRPDVIHVHNAQDFLSPVLVHRLHARAPTLRYVHDARLFCPRVPSKRLARSDEPCPHAMGARCLMHCFPIDSGGGYKRPLKELALLYADLAVTRHLPAVLVGSRYMREQMELNGVRAERLHELCGFTDKALDLDPVTAVEPHLLAIGRFDGIKGLEDLPRLFARLSTPHWRATLVGDGPRLEATRSLAESLGLADRIRFTGALESSDLDRLYASAAVVVMASSVPEAFGLVGIEAMAFGKPVVAFDRGGVREWLRHGETGYLVEPGDEAGFTQRIDRLLGDAEERDRLGWCGRERVDACFRPGRHLRQLLEIYTAMTAERGRTAWASA